MTGAGQSPGPPQRAWSLDELMFVEASRRLTGAQAIFVGSGISFAAAMLAQRIHAPCATMLVDSGAVGPRFGELPRSVTDRHVTNSAVRLGSMREVLGMLVRRPGVVAILGAAEVDRFGNVNSTYVGREGGPPRRLPGSGGATAVAWSAERWVLLLRHERRRFPARVGFISSPGYIEGPDVRGRLGLSAARPLISVVTDLCVMETSRASGLLEVAAVMPDVSIEEVYARTGFRPSARTPLGVVAHPTDEEITTLRTIDPTGLYVRGIAGRSLSSARAGEES